MQEVLVTCPALWIDDDRVECEFPHGHPGSHRARVQVDVDVPDKYLTLAIPSTLPTEVDVEWEGR